jgi:HPt (histidine-containing phosphotransfer) domain-containing protein
MVMNNAGFESRVAELRARYVHSLPALVAAIRDALRGRPQAGPSPGSLDRQFHSLAGTAGTFGLHAIAATALDGFDECSSFDETHVDGGSRYLWSIVEELEDQVARPSIPHPLELPGHHAA